MRPADLTPRRVDPVAEPATLDAMDVVMQQAYGVASFRSSIDRFVATQPDGLAVVEHDGAVVGAGCCLAYPDAGFGWVGLVATIPGFQRRGIATVVTEHLATVLAGYGCAAVLDASAAGAPVYERMGFVDCGLTRVMVFAGDGSPAAGTHRCVPLDADDLDQIVDYDAARFGATRRSVLAAVIRQNPGRGFVVRSGKTLTGYLVAQESTLGPVVADDAAALGQLITAALGLDWPVPPRINVPPESSHVGTLKALGFDEQRQLRHMRRGIDVLPGRRGDLAGEISLGEG